MVKNPQKRPNRDKDKNSNAVVARGPQKIPSSNQDRNNNAVVAKGPQKMPNSNQDRNNKAVVAKGHHPDRKSLTKKKNPKVVNKKQTTKAVDRIKANKTNRNHIMVSECCRPSDSHRCQYPERIIFQTKVAHLSCHLITHRKAVTCQFHYLFINKTNLAVNCLLNDAL